MSQFVASTTLSIMRSLGSPAERSLHRLQAVLGREFPNGIGFELAEPVPRKDGSGIDWYADLEEPPVRLTDLPTDTASIHQARLDESVQSVLSAAAAHEARGDAASKSIAILLRNAVTYPGNENVWVVESDGTIILTAWGYEKHDSEISGRSEIVATAARDRVDLGMRAEVEPTAAPSVAAPIQARTKTSQSPSWPSAAMLALWAVPLLLALWIAWLLLPACGLRLPWGGTLFGDGKGAFCAIAAPLQTLDPASARTKELMSEAAVLEEQLRRHLASCRPEALAPPAVEPPRPPPNPDVENAEELLGNEGIVLDDDETAVALTWDGASDLDLFVMCPSGETVPLGGERCGAKHFLDLNISGDRSHSVEVVRWGNQEPIAGHYQIHVKLYTKRDAVTNFKVILKRKGRPEQVVPGQISESKELQKVMEFDVP